MTTETMTTPEQRRKNILLAWGLAALVLFIMLSSIPFWRGLYQLAMNSGL